MSNTLFIAGFGNPVSKNTRLEDVDLEEVIAVGLQQLNDTISLNDVEKIYTSMNADVTGALMDAVDNLNLDIEVEQFHPCVNYIAKENNINRQDAWKQAFKWWNNRLFVNDDEDDDQDLVDLTVRFGDAGNNGEAFLQQARHKGVPALDFNLDDLVDKNQRKRLLWELENEVEADEKRGYSIRKTLPAITDEVESVKNEFRAGELTVREFESALETAWENTRLVTHDQYLEQLASQDSHGEETEFGDGETKAVAPEPEKATVV